MLQYYTLIKKDLKIIVIYGILGLCNDRGQETFPATVPKDIILAGPLHEHNHSEGRVLGTVPSTTFIFVATHMRFLCLVVAHFTDEEKLLDLSGFRA